MSCAGLRGEIHLPRPTNLGKGGVSPARDMWPGTGRQLPRCGGRCKPADGPSAAGRGRRSAPAATRRDLDAQLFLRRLRRELASTFHTPRAGTIARGKIGGEKVQDSNRLKQQSPIIVHCCGKQSFDVADSKAAGTSIHWRRHSQFTSLV